MGLLYAPIAKAKRTYASYRKNEMRKYLVKHDRFYRAMKAGKTDFAFVFIDESYAKVHHA